MGVDEDGVRIAFAGGREVCAVGDERLFFQVLGCREVAGVLQDGDVALDGQFDARPHGRVADFVLVVELDADHARVQTALNFCKRLPVVAGDDEAEALDALRMARHGVQYGVVGLSDVVHRGDAAAADGAGAPHFHDAQRVAAGDQVVAGRIVRQGANVTVCVNFGTANAGFNIHYRLLMRDGLLNACGVKPPTPYPGLSAISGVSGNDRAGWRS